MKTTVLTLSLLAATATNAIAQQQPGNHKLPEITVHPRNPYIVEVEPGEWNEAHVRQWIAYCHPVLSVADSYGVRHYVYNGNPGCEYGISAR